MVSFTFSTSSEKNLKNQKTHFSRNKGEGVWTTGKPREQSQGTHVLLSSSFVFTCHHFHFLIPKRTLRPEECHFRKWDVWKIGDAFTLGHWEIILSFRETSTKQPMFWWTGLYFHFWELLESLQPPEKKRKEGADRAGGYRAGCSVTHLISNPSSTTQLAGRHLSLGF